MIKAPKKLIEVALPLDDINREAAHEKSIRRGHPSTLHMWWARRPLAAARAVIFAQMVNDPGGQRGWTKHITKEAAQKKREELFEIIRELVKWENTNNKQLLAKARSKIQESWRETCELNKGEPGFERPELLPGFHDPFAGGGAIPLEAQRLGLDAWASDLNPVPVMINKAMIEIPPRFADRMPVGLPSFGEMDSARTWRGAAGLAEDVNRYGCWMLNQARTKIAPLYPKVKITAGMTDQRPDLKKYIGRELTVVSWLWARTVKSPDPQFSKIDVPLASTFVLSTKEKKTAWVGVQRTEAGYQFVVHVGAVPPEAKNGTKSRGVGASFQCVMSNAPITPEYIRNEARNGRLGDRLMAIVCDGDRERVYLSPVREHEDLVGKIDLDWTPDALFCKDALGFRIGNYGMNKWSDLYTKRQLFSLSVLCDQIENVRCKVVRDAVEHGWISDGVRLVDGGKNADAYADAVVTYLAFAIDKTAERNSTMCTYMPGVQCPGHTFGRQALPMTWDYAEANLLDGPSGSFASMNETVFSGLLSSETSSEFKGHAVQADAQTQDVSTGKVVSMDPPYYDNIGYADLSDYFYVWMRHCLRNVYPDVFSTIVVPKDDELVATPCRHGGNEAAGRFFLDGMKRVFDNLATRTHPAYPITVYYAFKQTQSDSDGTGNAGWETFLEAVVQSGFVITGTWPMDTERANRKRAQSSNALASSIVLVCRKRDENADEISRQKFLEELSEVMPEALRAMQGLDGVATPVAPVDMAQAAIGPGMEVFSQYKQVINADGSRMSVHDAIIEINNYLNGGEAPDADTLFCQKWFDKVGWSDGPFGEANTLAQALGTSVGHVVDSSVLKSAGGRAQLVHWTDYPKDYDPASDKNRPCWEAMHNMVRALVQDGEAAAGAMLAQMQEASAAIRDLAYTMYTQCERRGFTDDARAYNALVTSWPAIRAEATKIAPVEKKVQTTFDL